jgi:hypothetical protein
MVRIHPYQYVAYNSLIGGLPGAAGRFELDYWDTSFAEATKALAVHVSTTGEAAPVVLVCGNRLSAAAAAPANMKFVSYEIEQADYLMSIERTPCGYLRVDMNKNRVVEIKRDGVVLSYVIDLRAQRLSQPETRERVEP